MRQYCEALLVVSLTLAAVPVAAQNAPTPAPSENQELVAPPNWAFNDLACAPQMATKAPDSSLRVVGSQDTAIRSMLGPGDTLVITGGSAANMHTGDQFYVRRVLKIAGHGSAKDRLSIHTAGWIQVLGVDTDIATATVVHACDGILLDDYLEPFVAPQIAAKPIAGDTPQYENMGRISLGDEGMQTAGAGQLMTIDRGTNDGVAPGQRFLVFRDKRETKVDPRGMSKPFMNRISKLPLVEIGQVLVLTVRETDATVQVVVSKDAIFTGDLVAPLR
jgi:hypothetical protein